mmetsp:Transcript_4232/g.17151  ORF Transcript_4232/g.17151 Transcript_4232/m.17151 type:complete len:271 (-) Transcript_4232:582-1394(-)
MLPPHERTPPRDKYEPAAPFVVESHLTTTRGAVSVSAVSHVSRQLSTSRSAAASSSDDVWWPFLETLLASSSSSRRAPKPSFVTHSTIWRFWGVGVNGASSGVSSCESLRFDDDDGAAAASSTTTLARCVVEDTAASATKGSALSAFSTFDEHAAHDIPSTRRKNVSDPVSSSSSESSSESSASTGEHARPVAWRTAAETSAFSEVVVVVADTTNRAAPALTSHRATPGTASTAAFIATTVARGSGPAAATRHSDLATLPPLGGGEAVGG